MSKRFVAVLSVAIAAPMALAAPAVARAPAILAAPNNQAPACATTGRLMAFLADRNKNFDARYSEIAALYKRIGTELGIRWDYAFHQMLVETGFLTYTGDVRASQNNFAGIGATGGGVRGESFRSVEDGVRAHLEHLLVYADVPVENPVADRTRKVQEWQLYKGWPKRLGRPVNFQDMAAKWAPNSGYWRLINSVAQRFMNGRCKEPDPAPQAYASSATAKPIPETPAAKPERETIDTAARSSLGASVSASAVSTTDESELATASAATTAEETDVAILNKSGEPDPAVEDKRPNASSAPSSTGTITDPNPAGNDLSVGRFASNFIAAPSVAQEKEPRSCRVWQASYGGQQAVIIKSVGGGHVNYTVLDVNHGREDREIEAYIAAYAKGGQTVGQFADQTKALRRAFELCPSAAQTQVSR